MDTGNSTIYSTTRLPKKVRKRLLLATIVTFVTMTVIFGTEDMATYIDCARDRFKLTISLRTLELTLLKT